MLRNYGGGGWNFRKARRAENSQNHAQGQSITKRHAHSRRSTSADIIPRNQPTSTNASPSEGPGSLRIGRSLEGRMEKRLPLIIVVRLSPVERLPTNEEERTYTDNISVHGVRVFSRRAWRPGEQAQVTPLNEESPMRGEVMYCQKLDNDHFSIGLKFPERPITWSTLRRYSG
jgi:hypothetical protein